MATRAAIDRQVRGFALIWTLITLLVGVATFFAVYLTYEGEDALPNFGSNDDSSIALAATNAPQQSIIVSTSVPAPTRTPEPAVSPTVTTESESQTEDGGVAVAQSVEQQPQTEATPLPVADSRFAVSIQVQAAQDASADVQQNWMNDVMSLHIAWMKQQIRWEDIEPVEGEFDWLILDNAINLAAQNGIKVIASVVTAPDWAREPGVSLEEEGPPADPQDYVDFILALLDRYPGEIHAIEVWNEQNLRREWTSAQGLSAANYVDLLHQTYIAIKAVDPGIIVISGALSPTGVSDGVNAIDDFDYLDQLIDVGLLNNADCVGAHHNGYNIGPTVPWDDVPSDPQAVFQGPFDNPHHSWSFYSTLQTYADKIALANGDQRLCVTEFGWASVEDLDGYPAGFEFALDNTLQEQADFTVAALTFMEQSGFVWIANIWNLNYGPQIGWDASNDNTPYSFIGPDWVRRPVYDAVARWTSAYYFGQ